MSGIQEMSNEELINALIDNTEDKIFSCTDDNKRSRKEDEQRMVEEILRRMNGHKENDK